MFKFFQNLFPQKKSKSDNSLKSASNIIIPQEVVEVMSGKNDVLRYPPADKGFPAKIPGQLLLSLQEEMLSKIKRELMIRDSEYNEFIFPMFENLANFVHLLPASEYHHHRAQGGLLRHTLEVVFYSIKIAKSFEFDANENPVIKSDRALAWRLAVVIGAVMHDIGKPISDVDIWDESGEKHWMPTVNCIHEWATAKDIERYFILWRTDRHERHHNTSLTKMTDIVPRSLLAFIMEEGNDIYNELSEAMAGNNSYRASSQDLLSTESAKNKIHKIISTADSRSVKEDLQKYSGDAVRSSQTGVPVIARIVDAMRYLLKKGVWVPNEPGSPVWLTTDGLFIVWTSAVDPITTTVKQWGTSVPHSAHSLADIMLSYGLCVLNEDDSVYWRIAPHILNDSNSRKGKEPKNALSCLKLLDPILLFQDDLTPNPVSCRIKYAAGWKEFSSSDTVTKEKISQPYIGEKPEEKSPIDTIPREILGSGNIPSLDEEVPTGKVKRGQKIKPDAVVDHLVSMNLLSKDDAQTLTDKKQSNEQTAIQSQKQGGENSDSEPLTFKKTTKADEVANQLLRVSLVDSNAISSNQTQEDSEVKSEAKTPSTPKENVGSINLKGKDAFNTKQVRIRLVNGLPVKIVEGEDEPTEVTATSPKSVTDLSPNSDNNIPSLVVTESDSAHIVENERVPDALGHDYYDQSDDMEEFYDGLSHAHGNQIQDVPGNNLKGEPTEQPNKTLTLAERLALAEKMYEENAEQEELLAKNKADLWEKASKQVSRSEENVPVTTPILDNSSASNHDVSEQTHILSSLYSNADVEAKNWLAHTLQEQNDELSLVNYRVFIKATPQKSKDLVKHLASQGWIWENFYQKSDMVVMHRAKFGFFLKRELTDDINFFTKGTLLEQGLSINPLENHIEPISLFQSLAKEGTVEFSKIGNKVLTLSGAKIRAVAKDLEKSEDQVRHLIFTLFDSIQLQGKEYILIDKRIEPYLVDNHE